jgi:hypothetical protein
MTQLADGLAPAKRLPRVRAADLVALTKPRITLMVVITTLGGLFLARRAEGANFSAWIVGWSVLGTSLIVAGANALNMYIERDIDGRMARTQNRPLPAGRLASRVALWFGVGLSVVAFPIGILLYLFHTRNTAYFYVAMATFYFMSYEVLHFCYHLDDDVWISRLPVIRALRRHHRIHHRLNLMLKYNFNITWPISDFFFGTIYRAPQDDSARVPAPIEQESAPVAQS